MTPSILNRALRWVLCASALLLLAGPVAAQGSDNLTVLSNFGRGDGESRSVFALGSRAYYGIGNRLVISDFSNPQSPTTLGSATVPDRVEDVVVVGNTAYVASGGGVSLFNVQNPTQIAELATVAAESYGEGLAVDPPYILLGDGSAGLRILDATTPSAPTEVAQVDTLGYVEGVSYSGDVAYVAAGSRIHLIDYSTPGSPTYAGRIGSPLDYYQSSAVRGSFLYVADFFGGFRVFDISTPSNPQDVGFFDPADRTARISLDGDFAYVANGDKGVSILDVSTPASPTEVAVIDTPGRALQAWVSGTLVFIADTEGVQVYDVSTPANPVFQSSIDVQAPADGKAFGINLQGDFAYVAYGDAGLRVLDASNPSGGLAQVAQLDVRNDADEGQARQVAVSGSYAYVASRAAGVRVVNVSNPAAPAIVTTLDVDDAGDVAVDGTTLVVAGGSGLTVFDITDPAAPVQRFASDGIGYADRVGVSGGYAYAITTGSDLRVFDLSDPSDIQLVGTVATGGDYSEGRITVQNDRLYTTNGDLLVVDVSDKSDPQVVGTYDAPSYAYSANVSGDYAYVATERDGVRLVDVSDPANPTEVGSADPGGEMRDVALRGGLAFAANGEGGVTVLQNNLFTAGEDGPARRGGLALWQNAPNPVRGTTAIRFELAAPGDVTVEVYTLLGQRVATVADEARGAGPHTVPFDASGLASGTYIVQVRSLGEQVMGRMTVVR
jgi:hypothetical protein